MKTARFAIEAAPQSRPEVAPDERWQHGQDHQRGAGDRVQRVVPGVQVLRDNGRIGDAHVAAADRWYQDYALGIEGAADPERRTSSNGRDHESAMIARLDAATRARETIQAIGIGMTARLKLFLVDELSCGAMAARYTPDREIKRATSEMAAQMAMLLEILAEHYAASDLRKKRQARSVAQLGAGTPAEV